VRRSQLPLLGVALLVPGLIAASVVQLLMWALATPARAALEDIGKRPILVCLIALTLLEELHIRNRGLRPLSVNRQVPQSWGHEHGPWKAALRYGMRLGVGPATMLNTWTWWAGAVLAAITSVTVSLVFATIFVCIRTFLTLAVPGSPQNGIELSARMQRWRTTGVRFAWIGLAALGVSVLLVAGTQ
jgi:hypothetical protein